MEQGGSVGTIYTQRMPIVYFYCKIIQTIYAFAYIIKQGPILLTWMKFNPNKDN